MQSGNAVTQTQAFTCGESQKPCWLLANGCWLLPVACRLFAYLPVPCLSDPTPHRPAPQDAEPVHLLCISVEPVDNRNSTVAHSGAPMDRSLSMGWTQARFWLEWGTNTITGGAPSFRAPVSPRTGLRSWGGQFDRAKGWEGNLWSWEFNQNLSSAQRG